MSEQHRELRQAEINAREILALAKTRARGFEELPKARIRCPRDQKTLARFFTGLDENDDARLWAWVPSFDHGWTKAPPTAAPVAIRAGEAAWTLHAQCERCRGWWLVVHVETASSTGIIGGHAVMSYRPEVSAKEPLGVGDRTVTGLVTDEYIQGPGPVRLYRVETSVRGSVSGQ